MTGGVTNSNEELLDDIARDLILFKNSLKIQDLVYICEKYGIQGHVAILDEPYLTRLLIGKKTIESRFLNRRVPPYKLLQPGMVLFLKRTSGPIQGIAIVSKVDNYGPLCPGEARELMQKYQVELCIEEPFANMKGNCKYATLIYPAPLHQLSDILLEKSDRRSWVVLKSLEKDRSKQNQSQQLSFLN